MGFSHEKTTHHFRLYRDGGAIEVTADAPAGGRHPERAQRRGISPRDSNDTAIRDQIRTHLTHIAKMFSEGDFTAPMLIHAPDSPVAQASACAPSPTPDPLTHDEGNAPAHAAAHPKTSAHSGDFHPKNLSDDLTICSFESALAVMKRLRSHIQYQFLEAERGTPSVPRTVPRGAQIRITSHNPEALKAIHDFLLFQIRDHRTADPESVISAH